jgi:hypothetical protein
MTGVYLNDGEQKVLDQLDYIYEALYRRGIRRYMDFKTGIVGIKRGVSWQSLKEELFVEAKQGSKSKVPSRETVRRIAKQLEKAGLIKIKSRSRKLIIECLLALAHRPVQKNPDRMSDTSTLKNNEKSDISKHFKKTLDNGYSKNLLKKSDTSNKKNDPKPEAMSDTPLYKDIYISTNVDILSDLKIKNIFEEYFWQPYPQGHRVKKKQAYEKYKRKKYYLSPHKEKIRDDILHRQKKHSPWLEGYVPHPTTYLNGERWNDEIQEEKLNARKLNGSKRGDSITRVLESCFGKGSQRDDDEIEESYS